MLMELLLDRAHRYTRVSNRFDLFFLCTSIADDKLLRWIARQISKRARETGSNDNISCIVAHLNSGHV